MRKSTIDKATFISKLREALVRAVQNNWDCFLMYYSGHGHPETGAWVVTLWEQSIDFEKA